MNIFVAGGSGAIGVPLVRALVANGHQVTALTRSGKRRDELRALGARVAVADALDGEALVSAVRAARPSHIVHQLTALPEGGPRRASDLNPTNRLRIEGTRHLLAAAADAGVRRFLVGSFAMLSARGTDAASTDAAAAAVQSMECQVLEANERQQLEGVVLRYGMFYGLEVPSTQAMLAMIRKRRLPVIRGDGGQLPFIQIDDAVSATLRALDAAPAGSVYDIVDDQAMSLTQVIEALAECTGSAAPFRVPAWLARLVAPYAARLTAVRMPLSNAKARAELGWRPAYPSLRSGLAVMCREAG